MPDHVKTRPRLATLHSGAAVTSTSGPDLTDTWSYCRRLVSQADTLVRSGRAGAPARELLALAKAALHEGDLALASLGGRASPEDHAQSAALSRDVAYLQARMLQK